MLNGSCLCGAISYRVDAQFDTIDCCHCLTCRKAHSSAFAMGVTIEADSFTLVSGESALAEYQSSADKFRVFCRHCGSQVYAYNPGHREHLRLRPALLDMDFNQFSYRHIYTDNRICMAGA